MLNQFTVLRNTAARNTPHIVFNIRYKPLNDQLTNYQVLLTVTGSTQIPLNFNAITQSANFLGLNGRTFPTPQDASDEVAQAIQEAMRLISREVGNSLSPNLMVKYKNEVFWNGHEILINKEGDNQITLQPLGKFGVPLSPEQISWTNASNGVVDMTGLQNKSITLTRLDTATILTVNIKRRSSFVLDIKTLLRPIVLQVLEERLAAVLDELMDELLLNSGSLLGELVLNLSNPAMLQSARNIIITYLNENMTRMAGSNFGMANDEPITVTRVQSATPAIVFDPATRLYIANNVDFPGKEAFKNELTAYLNTLDTPLYVFVNYSQDLSTETYLKRTIGTRPAGLPQDAQFVTLTLVNIPGSVQYQVFGSKAGVQVNNSLPAKDLLMDYVKGDEEGVMVAAKKPKPIVIIADNTMTEGKVFVHNTTINQIKVKFETSDTSKTKVAYQLKILVESTETTINYPNTGFDTIVYNQIKEIILDSIPQGKYTMLCKAAKTDYTINFFIRKQKLEITKEQLKTIFPTTDDKRIEEVVKSINENSSTYDISTPERMAHFLGQIGAETGGLKKLKESPLYSPRTVVAVFPYPKYGHLFENISLDSTTYNYSYRLINYNESKCNGEEMSRGTTVFPCSNSSEIVNAYAATKSDTLEVTLSGKKTKVLVYKKRTDATKDNIKQKVTDDDYNSGLLKVKSKYIRSAALFDVTYGCRMGNGDVASNDGSTYLGKGFIHITGKGGYKEVSDEWNKLYPNDKKEFHGKDISLLETDIEVAIKASMVYWKIKGLNQEADKGTSEEVVEKIGKIVNGGSNGETLRKSYTKLAADNLK